ncbi:hypothetical protein ANCCAN_05371 [Ancylostoma caninum]|uniref:Peptidase M12A domain-containing protein n=1 Tax=Ancylostoma caninum TaxID=29170 RepID=A0A368GW01_ANCCA|nr:hypothetical protein ANCCAN_05371 [Ancylostoma caninum]
MIPWNGNYNKTMGSPFVSLIDKVLINKHYNCSDKCSGVGNKCENNGFPDPKNCSVCVCPSGYGGPPCKDKPNDCGTKIDASDTWKTITLDAPASENNGKYNICTHWIKTESQGKEIQVELVSISGGRNDTIGCETAGIEIKTNNDQRLTGYRLTYQLFSTIFTPSTCIFSNEGHPPHHPQQTTSLPLSATF